MIELSTTVNGRSIQREAISAGNSFPDIAPEASYKTRTLKYFVAVSCIAFASALISSSLGSPAAIESETKSVTTVHTHFDLKTLEPLKFHQSGFGALNYHHHQDSSQFRRFLDSINVFVPRSAVPHAIPSLGEPNIINLNGHYVHDEHRSPFASALYDRPNEELEKEQAEFVEKMEKVRREWGVWSFRDHSSEVRPVQDFSQIQYKDIQNKAWQKNVWQTDEKYVTDLIAEGRKLVDRMIEGIYAEYGYPTKKADGSMISDDDKQARETLFGISLIDNEDLKDTYRINRVTSGSAILTNQAFDALARKLLHGMITNDEFYYVTGGHSAAAGHGNNLPQQYTMSFSHIMEPIFHRLGMRLIARNLAMGGYGTLHFSLGQANLYGETDVLQWDSGMTEKDMAIIELFNRQGVLKGERVPILLTEFIGNILKDTNEKAWVGDILPFNTGVPKTESIEQGMTLPWATQFLECTDDARDLCGGRGYNKYNAVCWVDRKDCFVPKLDRNDQRDKNPGGQASWHPGWRQHQLQGRKISMLFLNAFKKAFDVWEQGMKVDGFPLHEKYWHVGSIYKDTQDTLHNSEGKDKGPCVDTFKQLGLEEVCYTAMHGMTQFTPINLGPQNSIYSHVKTGANGQPRLSGHKMWSGPNLLPTQWKIPAEDVDVHAIAIASDYEAAVVDHFWENAGDDDSVEEDAESGRRLLSQNDFNMNRSVLSSTGIVPGEGWGSYTDGEVDEYCDGSPMSECNRSKDESCYLYANNDRHGTISGDGTSGWLVINIPNIKKGIIAAKMEWWHPRNDWKVPEDKDRRLNDEEPKRNLGGKVIPYPDDFGFDISINGKITTWDSEKFAIYAKEIAYNEAIYPLVNDETLSGDVEVALRVRSESNPKVAGLSVTHIYWS